MNPEITKIYGNRLRLRVCGLCWEDGNMLLVNHRGLNAENFWSPPGGGVEFGESLENALKREVEEETGMLVRSPQFAFGCEFIRDPLHAIELFFFVKRAGGKLKSGYDPEFQVIHGTGFFSDDQIRAIPPGELHGIFQIARTANDFHQLSGFYSI